MTRKNKGWLNDWQEGKEEKDEKMLNDLTLSKPYDTFIEPVPYTKIDKGVKNGKRISRHQRG